MSVSINIAPDQAGENVSKRSIRSPGSVSLRSPSFSGTESTSGKSSKKISIEEKLDDINKKLAEVRQQRLESEKKDKKPQKKRSVGTTKSSFHHPKLDYVIGEIVHSPYMTKPQEAYPSETFRVQEKLRELKRTGSKLSELPHEERPFDMEETKSRFIEEVVKYNVTYTLPVRFETVLVLLSKIFSLI